MELKARRLSFELFVRWSCLDELGKFFVNRLLQFVLRSAGRHRGIDHKGRSQQQVILPGADISGKLVLDDQTLIEAAIEPRGQDRRRQIHLRIARLISGRTVPDHNGLGCLDLIGDGHSFDAVEIERWDRLARYIVLAGQGPKELCDEWLNFCRLEIPGDNHRCVVRYVVGSEECLNIGNRRIVQVLHRPDHTRVVRVKRREHDSVQRFVGSAVGRVLRILASFVLDDVALEIQLLLSHRTTKVFESVCFEPK